MIPSVGIDIRKGGQESRHCREPGGRWCGERTFVVMPLNLEFIGQKLEGYPPEVVDALGAFARNGDIRAFEEGLLGALGFLSERSDVQTLSAAADEVRLREDLGVDSLAVAELVFLIEDTFGVPLQDDEINGLKSVGDFKCLAREKVAARLV